MSKFLKLIVDLVIICTILIAAALLVPPLAGVKTVMNDNSTAETNLPVGSVAYGKQTDAVNLKKGQKIVIQKIIRLMFMRFQMYRMQKMTRIW